jgi:3'-5' exoribonuclease
VVPEGQAIVDLTADRVVEGVFAVRAKRKLRTKAGAPYLALELVDPTGRIEARVWNDVELLDGRFAEGDAVRVLGRVERFRDRLQLDVRSLEASEVDPASLTPALRRDAEELQGFLEFLAAEISHAGLGATVRAVLADRELDAYPATPGDHHSYAGGLLEHTVGVSIRGCAATCCSRRRSCTTWGGRSSSGGAPPSRRPTRDACSATSISGCGWSRSARRG